MTTLSFDIVPSPAFALYPPLYLLLTHRFVNINDHPIVRLNAAEEKTRTDAERITALLADIEDSRIRHQVRSLPPTPLLAIH